MSSLKPMHLFLLKGPTDSNQSHTKSHWPFLLSLTDLSHRGELPTQDFSALLPEQTMATSENLNYCVPSFWDTSM
jgi:hypothetical protein